MSLRAIFGIRQWLVSCSIQRCPLLIGHSNANVRYLGHHGTTDGTGKNQIQIDEKFTTRRRFTADDVKTFAGLSDDYNPIHLDEEYAATTKYKKPIVHGMLVNSLFSGLLAKHLGDGAVLLSIECSYLRPVFVDEEITAEIQIKEASGLRVLVSMRCISNTTNKVAIEGSARGLLSRHRDQGASDGRGSETQADAGPKPDG